MKFARLIPVLAATCCLMEAVCQVHSLVVLRTSVGPMIAELYDQDKPATVQNFLRYVGSGAYNDMFFHRWVSGFVIQGGGFFTAKRQTATPEIMAIPTYAYVTNEYKVGRTNSNTYGTLAMARIGGYPDSASSQFFINLANNAFLDDVDGGFTVFGRVLLGTNVLERFNNTSITNGLFLYTGLASPLNQLPVLNFPPGYEDLIYAGVSLVTPIKLQLAVKAPGEREISWTSLSNFVNRLESTVVMPPVWRPMFSTNGNGGTVRYTDRTSSAALRFYRVVIE